MSPESASKVYYSRTENRKKFTEKILKMFAPEMKGKKKILVKPNIVSYEPYPTTTHPDVLRCVLAHLQKTAKAAEIIVGDGTVPDSPVTLGWGGRDVIKTHELAGVCKEFGLRLRNLYDFGFRKVETSSGFALRVSKVALEADYMISLPIMKTHCIRSIGITGALKNNFGLLASKDRIVLHSSGGLPFRAARKVMGASGERPLALARKILGIRKEINLAIAELNAIRKPDLFIVDMVDTLINANELRHGGIKKHAGLMFAGKDPVALDCFGLGELRKIDPALANREWHEIPAIRHALRLGIGTREFKKMEIRI